MLELWISVDLQRNVAQRIRIKMRTKRTVQDVEILASGERKKSVSLGREGQTPANTFQRRVRQIKQSSEQFVQRLINIVYQSENR